MHRPPCPRQQPAGSATFWPPNAVSTVGESFEGPDSCLGPIFDEANSMLDRPAGGETFQEKGSRYPSSPVTGWILDAAPNSRNE